MSAAVISPSSAGTAAGLRLSAVGFCGVDESVRPEELHELSARHPYIEWGVLVRPELPEGKPRYASRAWLQGLAEASSERGRLRLAAHLCGEAARRFLVDGDSEQVESLCADFGFQRVQVNPTSANGFDSARLASDGAFLAQAAGNLLAAVTRLSHLEFILQVNSETKPLLDHIFSETARSDGRDDAARCRPTNLTVLFDPSCGLGIVGERPPPLADVRCGYAGGLGPDTVLEELVKISRVVGSVGPLVWIDMETKVRSLAADGRDIFDLGKVRDVLAKIEASGVVFAA